MRAGAGARGLIILALGEGRVREGSPFPLFSTVAKLVEALKRSIPEGTRNAELKAEAPCASPANCSAGRSTKKHETGADPSPGPAPLFFAHDDAR